MGEALLTRRTHAFEQLTDALGGLLDTLQAQGVLDNTFVVITSDEAGGHAEEGESDKPMRSNFGVMALRMPSQGRWPALAPAETLVAHMDVAVTVLDLLGLDEAGNMIGSSMLNNPDDGRAACCLATRTAPSRTFCMTTASCWPAMKRFALPAMGVRSDAHVRHPASQRDRTATRPCSA